MSKEQASADQPLPDGIIGIIDLRNPIEDQDGNSIEKLEIREPTAQDYVDCGDPFAMDAETGKVSSNTKAGMEYLVRSTGIHAPYLKKMHPLDLMRAMGEINGFFGQA